MRMHDVYCSDTPADLDYIPGILNFVNFQPPGDSAVCTTFEIIDDMIGLEDVERFVIDVVSFDGSVVIGRINRTVINIEDSDSKPQNTSRKSIDILILLLRTLTLVPLPQL